MNSIDILNIYAHLILSAIWLQMKSWMWSLRLLGEKWIDKFFPDFLVEVFDVEKST
jgi:hypothetical protein